MVAKFFGDIIDKKLYYLSTEVNMFIVKLIRDLTAFDMGYDEEIVIACGKIKSAIAEAEKVVDEEFGTIEEDVTGKSREAVKRDFVKWSNAINGGFEFYSDSMGERRIVEIMEVDYVD